ncbi:MAG: cbb3-type cytochrome c oxidase subunit I, partial [Anaerolineae bacterium]|nr:cbb3-type cytochrome c oxidase subunit I [Anaerolineae bacterium]
MDLRGHEEENYLNWAYGVKSWLLTTDHKRIALLYLVSVTFFFFLGSLAAFLLRIDLMTPQGDLMTSDHYNRSFTIHGVIMVFLFLIPAIPGIFGNFLVPLMIGAKDLAFPRINLGSWYVYIISGMFIIAVVIWGGVDTGWTFYTPYSTTYANSAVVLTVLGVFLVGFSSIMT